MNMLDDFADDDMFSVVQQIRNVRDFIIMILLIIVVIVLFSIILS